MTFKKKYSMMLVLLLSAQSVRADVVSFNEVWQKINSASPLQEAARLQEKSLSEAQARVSRHWLPHIYLDARTYQTNDPGHSFFGLLQQRQVQTTDFSPSLLNHPESSTFTKASIGLDMPLYEGGVKINQVSVYNYSLKAQQFASRHIEIMQYSKVGQAYGSINTLNKQLEKLNAIDFEIKKILKSYQIGQKSNPVGYSGLLGMRSLINRLMGLSEQYKAQSSAYSQALIASGFQEKNWKTEQIKTLEFVDKYFKLNSEKAESSQLLAKKEEVKATSAMAEIERGRFLPRLGAFAESSLFNGQRDTASGYTAGIYLQWSLFDPADYGKLSEAKLKALALDKQNEAFFQQETAELAVVVEANKAMRSNLKLLEDSDNLLNEQMQVATTLFRNGSITALQLVEILNRRTDIVVQQNDLELALIKNASEGITKTYFQIPLTTKNGGQ